MDSKMYHHLVDRVGRLDSMAEVESLRRELMTSFGDTQRRRVLLAALDERRDVIRQSRTRKSPGR